MEYNWLISATSTVNIMDSDEVETVQSSQGSCTLISFVNICPDDVTESENSDVEALVEQDVRSKRAIARAQRISVRIDKPVLLAPPFKCCSVGTCLHDIPIRRLMKYRQDFLDLDNCERRRHVLTLLEGTNFSVYS